MWFLALISSYPEVQARAHAELDNVVGRDDWPCAEDEQRLPYIRAIIKEVRWEKLAGLPLASHE
jgi:cytochrome P450